MLEISWNQAHTKMLTFQTWLNTSLLRYKKIAIEKSMAIFLSFIIFLETV